MSYRPTDRMPCHISDGPQTPEDMLDYGEPLEDEDAAFEEYHEIEIAARELEDSE